MKDEGFTVAELLAALIVLSLGMMFLGEAIFHEGRSWNRISHQVNDTARLEALYSEVIAADAGQKSHAPLGEGPVLIVDDGPPLELSAPHIDKTAACRFDPIGRRCR